MTARIAVVVGNPKPASRTLAAAQLVARGLAGREPDLVLDLATLGPALLDWEDASVTSWVSDVGATDVVVVASPTYKGTYTGLLKLFLDRFPPGGLRGVVVPLMLGAGLGHALAPELSLRPVLTELGATTVRGHYQLDSLYDDPDAYGSWLREIRPLIDALTHEALGVVA
ncbi:NAD(P)H-dependent oxidoreductase [Nocardioides sp.]|uniref:NADPH-dependent FMN reductase n=1 Tax=Nocardioides sp. TaxID=35761 RepID=UPI002ED0DEAF